MNVYVRHYHNISQSPRQDTELRRYSGAWDLDSVWAWLRKEGIPAGSKSRQPGSMPRVEDDTLVFFLTGTYHSIVVGPVDGHSAVRHNGRA